jgi:hypothetical protein
MQRPALCACLALPLTFFSALAAAQTTSPPGNRERELAQIIRQAGYDCRAVDHIDVAPIPDMGLESFRPEVAVCTNGKKFLVAKGGRGGANARTVVRPLPTDI